MKEGEDIEQLQSYEEREELGEMEQMAMEKTVEEREEQTNVNEEGEEENFGYFAAMSHHLLFIAREVMVRVAALFSKVIDW